MKNTRRPRARSALELTGEEDASSALGRLIRSVLLVDVVPVLQARIGAAIITYDRSRPAIEPWDHEAVPLFAGLHATHIFRHVTLCNSLHVYLLEHQGETGGKSRFRINQVIKTQSLRQFIPTLLQHKTTALLQWFWW